MPFNISRGQLTRELGCQEFGNFSAKSLTTALTAAKVELKFDERVQFYEINPGNGGSYTAGLLESYMLQELNTHPIPHVTVAHHGDAIENAGRTSNYELKGMLKNKERGILRGKIVVAYILNSQLKPMIEKKPKQSRLQDFFMKEKGTKRAKFDI